MDFDSIGKFVEHFVTLELAVHKAAEHGLREAAKVIEAEAKAELGYYQPAVQSFPEWEQLAESTLAQHAALGIGDTPLMLTGQLYASIEHQVHGTEAVIGTLMDIGAYQEFGTEKIPPRPFMGPAAFHSKDRIEKIMGHAVMAGLLGGNALIGHTIMK